jgi:F-type H+-transporting ATPase subunit gamma
LDATELRARARTIAQLADIVQAMRTLANAQRRRAQERFAGLMRYAAGTRAALEEALALMEGEAEVPSRPAAAVVWVVALSSEHGFVGSLDDRLLDVASSVSRARGARLIVVGARGVRLARERGVDAEDGGAMPVTLAAVQQTAQRLIDELFGAIAEGSVTELHLVFAEHRGPLGWEPRALQLFPPAVSASPRTAGSEPIHTLAPSLLVVRAIEEYAFAQVSWAVGEAYACERAARFLVMDAARRHIQDKLAELRALERQLRQETITSEILEVTSAAASTGGEP